MNNIDKHGWMALSWLIIGGILYVWAGHILQDLFPSFQSRRGHLLEGAVLRFSFMPLGMLLMFVIFREWFEGSGLRLLIAIVQWLVAALAFSVILRNSWERYGTYVFEMGYAGGPYTIAPTGIVLSLGVFLLIMLGTLFVTDTGRHPRPNWEKWLEYSPLLVAGIVVAIALLVHEKPAVI
ncbi:MAG: hypothetical protein AB8F95_11280 [Bacteroidia bacterium]